MPSAEITSYKPTRRELLKLLADSVHFGLDPYIAVWQYSHMEMNVHADRLLPVHLSHGLWVEYASYCSEFLAYRWPTNRPLCRFYRFLGVAFL